jgi:hypothetical protein
VDRIDHWKSAGLTVLLAYGIARVEFPSQHCLLQTAQLVIKGISVVGAKWDKYCEIGYVYYNIYRSLMATPGKNKIVNMLNFVRIFIRSLITSMTL